MIPIPASTVTDTYASATIIADVQEGRRVIAKAWSRIHAYDLATTHTDYTDPDARFIGSGPSLGVNELASGTTFTASTTAVRVGFVYGEFLR